MARESKAENQERKPKSRKLRDGCMIMTLTGGGTAWISTCMHGEGCLYGKFC